MAPWSQSVAQPPPTAGKKEKKNVMLAPQHGQPPLLPPHQKQSTLACGSHAPSGGTLKQSIINMYGQKYGSRLQQQKELQPSQGSDVRIKAVARLYVCSLVCIFICMFMCTMIVWLYALEYKRMHIRTNMCVFARLLVHWCVCVCVCVYMCSWQAGCCRTFK